MLAFLYPRILRLAISRITGAKTPGIPRHEAETLAVPIKSARNLEGCPGLRLPQSDIC